MATALTHAVLPYLVGTARDVPRRVRIFGSALALVADADIISFLFDVRAEELLGHRGLFHSLLAAVVLGLLAAAAARGHRAFLVACALSHPVLDLFTFGGGGVALLAPLTNARFGLPFAPVPSLPVGFDEAVGQPGLLVLANEVLWLWAPCVLVLLAVRRVRPRVLAAATLAWSSMALSLRLQLPEVFGLPLPRILEPVHAPERSEDLARVPRDGLPDGGLATDLASLAPLFGVRHAVEPAPWSGSFFPYWFGGEAGRWRDPNPVLAWRTLAGVEPPSADALRELVQRAQSDAAARAELDRLSPIEKYDLARGDYGLTATRLALAQTHNSRPRPRFWFGLCNGVAAAGLRVPEPFRRVDVVSPDGHHVSFHPNDVKALLASAHYAVEGLESLGDQCVLRGVDAARLCSMNAGSFVITALNRLGRARSSFIVDVFPSVQSQFYAVGAARIALLGAPRPWAGERAHAALEGRVKQLVDFEAELELSSTLLPVGEADRVDPAHADGSWYLPVGMRAVPASWKGTLALDANGEIIGGRWSGETGAGPDCVAFVNGGPAVTDAGALETNAAMSWSSIAELAAASVQTGAEVPTVDARAWAGNVADGGP